MPLSRIFNVEICVQCYSRKFPNLQYIGGSYMSAPFLFNLLTRRGKEIKCNACLAFYHTFSQ